MRRFLRRSHLFPRFPKTLPLFGAVQNLWRKRLLVQLVGSFLIVSLTMVSLMGYLAFVQAKEALKASVFAQLNITASLKERELGRWLTDQGQDLLAFSHLPSVEENAQILLTTPSQDPRYVVAQQALQENLERFVEYQDGLEEVFLLSRGGRVLGASDRQIIGQFQPLSQYSEITRDENTPLLSNFYRSASTGNPQMTLATPSKNAQGQTLGLFATHLNLDRMDQIIRQQVSLGATGETYLVSDIGSSLAAKNVLVSAQAGGKLEDLDSIDSYGIQQALKGQRGQGLYLNYRQQPVIGVYAALPGKGLALLVEQSQWEAFAPARSLAILLLGLGITLSALMAGGMVLLGRQIIRPIRAIAQTARRVSTGDLTCQTPILTDNELGQLAQGFNHMIDQLQQSYQTLSDYNHTLETNVFERTQALQLKNQELESTLAELTRTQTHLIQNEKMAGLGQLVAGVAHEINNPVNFIHGNLSHLDQYSQDLLGFVEQYQQVYPHPHPDLEQYIEDIDLDFLQEDLPKVLTSMRIGTERIREIVLSLRTFSRLDESEQKAVDIHTGLESTLLILYNRFKGKGDSSPVELVKHYGDLPLVDCYPGQLNQVFVNLISNALDALEEQENRPPNSSPQITITTAVVGEDRVRIEIADNGPGMSEEVRGKLFDPFFTTKPIGKGTGLGMSISYSIIVERHQGTITCDSRLGEGTRFCLEIPLRQVRG